MSRKSIRKLRDHIAALDPSKFDMRQPWLHDGCGCIKAHGEALLGEKAWAKAVGSIPGEAYAELVMPYGWFEQPQRYPRDAAVRVLDHFLETGKVDWSIIDGDPS